ncbi:MAG: glycosyltransferase family 2 protein [Candidatus Vogelbacteria bacterium]|nr:glycosyltransferase family 2 protein [Candidatus Vogelbacteria bacterium]
MKKKKVSIIIRSYNEEKWISPCLQAVFNQRYNDFEVILVDNLSKDQTVKRARHWPVKIISVNEFLPGRAINAGIKKSSGDYIVCLSAHCIPVNDRWLGNLLLNFDDNKVAGVYGRQEPLAFTSDTDKRDLITVFGLDKKIQLKDSFFHNANSMIRRDIWKKIPFDEKITNIEDRLWAREILRAGYKIIYEPEASVYHYHGIHQNQNLERLNNVVKIIENLNARDGYKFSHLNLEHLNVIAMVPVKGEMLKINGKALLQYTIENAKKAKSIKQVIVLTDSEQQAAAARKLGAQVPFIRDNSLSGEHVGLEHVYQYSIQELEKRGIMADVVVTLEVTFPFRPKGFIDQLVLRLLQNGLDSVVAARPEYGACWIKENGTLRQIDAGFMPRKFKDPVYVSIKGLGSAMLPIFLREGRLLGDKVGIVEIDNPHASIEVRDKVGVQFAESVIKNWVKGRR